MFFFWGVREWTVDERSTCRLRVVPGGLVRRHLVGAAGDSTGALHCGLCTRRGLGRSGVVVESKRGTYRTATKRGVMRKRWENEISEIHEYFQWMIFLLEPSLFCGNVEGLHHAKEKKQSCCLVADSSLFGDTNLIKGWEWVGVTMVFLLIPASDHIDLAIPVHLIKAVAKDTFTFHDEMFWSQPKLFSAKKKPCLSLCWKKGLHQDDEPCSILYQVAAWGVLYERPNGQKGVPAFRRSRSPGAWPQAALAFLAKVHRACRTGREAALRLGRLMGWAEGYGLMGVFEYLKRQAVWKKWWFLYFWWFSWMHCTFSLSLSIVIYIYSTLWFLFTKSENICEFVFQGNLKMVSQVFHEVVIYIWVFWMVPACAFWWNKGCWWPVRPDTTPQLMGD